MANGVSLTDLGDLPLETWASLYRVARSRELSRLAADVSVVHSADPQTLRNRLSAEAMRVSAPSEAPKWAEPAEIARTMAGIPGVRIKRQKQDVPEG